MAQAFKIVPPPEADDSDEVMEVKPSSPAKAEPVPAETAPLPAAKAPAETKPPSAPVKRSGSPVRKIAFGAVLLAALAGAGWYGKYWFEAGRFTVSTDDAYVQADKSPLSAQVAGLVTEILVKDNQAVKKGDKIAVIDDGDYALALALANAKIETQKAAITRIEAQLAAQSAVIGKAQAQIEVVNSDLGFAQTKLERQTTLAAQKLAADQTRDDAKADVSRLEAQLVSAKTDVDAANLNRDVIASQVVEAKQVLSELQTTADKAKRDLTQTAVIAPFDGIVSGRAIEVGQYVEPGQRVAFLVPNQQLYVEANFKETQLAGVHDGQDVTLAVDALSDPIHGKVDSIAPASGAEFSLLPPENATGNFTKVVQRIPVRISIDAADQNKLRVGYSVTASINTKTGS